MFKLIAVIGIFSTLALATDTRGFNPDPLAGTWNVFGADDRERVTNTAYPWSTIGKIEVAGSWCTGTLIGAKLVLTAAHCLKLRAGRLDSRYAYRFFPNVIRNYSAVSNSPRAIHAWHAGYRAGDPSSKDWAILLLDRQPKRSDGTTFGWMGVAGTQVSPWTPITTVGYSSNFQYGQTAGADQSCHVRETYRDGTLFHDCDGWGGISGGPMFNRTGGEAHIVGVTNSHFALGTPGLYVKRYAQAYANVGVASSNFIQLLLRLKRTYE